MTGSTPPNGPAPRPATVVVAFRPASAGRRVQEPAGRAGRQPDPAAPVGRVPRVARVLALAHRWKALIDDGTVADQAALARLVGVSRARVTQVMDLLRLAPDIQEAVLLLPPDACRRSRLGEREARSIASLAAWSEQRIEWAHVGASST